MDEPAGGRAAQMERDERRSALLAQIDRIAAKTHWMKRGGDGQLEPDYAGLSNAAGLSRSGLNGIIEGAEPKPRTLIAVARYAGESVVPLFRAARWLTAEDEAVLCGAPLAEDEETTLVDEALATGDVSEEEMATALRVMQRFHHALAARARDRAQRLPATSSEQPPTAEQGSAE